jgi:UDP-3-O-[3-hydroxymyristoyl] glucosamine N-acyltransferase
MTLARIAEITGGSLKGKGEEVITGIAPLERAGPSDLSFVQGPSLYGKARQTKARALLCPEPLPWFHGAQIVVPDAKIAMASVLAEVERQVFGREAQVCEGARVDRRARLAGDVFLGEGVVVEETAEIAKGARIHANAVVGRGARIGAGSVVHAGAVIGEGTRIGSGVVVGPNTTLGSAGFGVVRRPDGALQSVPQVGSVVVEDDVEIGALCTVDRGTMGPTVIGQGTKMDNHCHIAHNVRIGRDCLLVAYARIAGSTVLEDGVTLAEDVGITDNVTIGRGARVGGGSRVYKDVGPGEEVWGAPAKPLAEERRVQALLRRLPRLREKVRELWRQKGS